MPTPADLEAMLDVLDDITNDSDATDFETAVDLIDQLVKVQRGAAIAVDLLHMQMLAQLEEGGPRTYGERLFKAIDDNVARYDHDEILRRAANDAFVDGNGEVRKTGEALERLATTLKALYVAPSTKAKVGAIDKLGIDRKEVISKHTKGRKVFVLDEREEP